MTVKFYKNISSPEEFKKSITFLSTLDVALKENCSVFTPTLIINLNVDLLNANYVYIEKFKRYYHIVGSVIIDGRQEVSLRCDVLASFPKTIKNSTFVFDRTTSKYNAYLPDNDKISSKHYIANLKFDSTPFTTSVYVGDDPTSAYLAHHLMIVINDGVNLDPPSTSEGGDS